MKTRATTILLQQIAKWYERRDEVMPEPGGSFELGGCLTSCVYDHDTSWR
jgi:hypothetical protein